MANIYFLHFSVHGCLVKFFLNEPRNLYFMKEEN